MTFYSNNENVSTNILLLKKVKFYWTMDNIG